MSVLLQVVDAAAAMDWSVAVDHARDLAVPEDCTGSNIDACETPDGRKIAEELQKFVAPIVAVIIGLVALKYLFGDSRSLAGFISFFLLAIAVFALIWFGDAILSTLAKAIKGWV